MESFFEVTGKQQDAMNMYRMLGRRKKLTGAGTPVTHLLRLSLRSVAGRFSET